jgi:CheY-like chemotaxis protein
MGWTRRVRIVPNRRLVAEPSINLHTEATGKLANKIRQSHVPSRMNNRRVIMLNEILNAMMLAELLYDRTVISLGPRSCSRQQENEKAAIRILHVDDEPEIREVVKLSLGLEPDFVTRSCDSGKEALAIAADWKPDLVLLDLIMPKMGGITTMSRLRIDAKPSMPVVFLTAFRKSQEIEYFQSLGANGVIFKPFEPRTLAASVRGYLHH